jgi:hypothetical protein
VWLLVSLELRGCEGLEGGFGAGVGGIYAELGGCLGVRGLGAGVILATGFDDAADYYCYLN